MFDHVVDDINIDMHTHMVIENDLSVYARNPQVAPPDTVGTSSIPHGCLIPDLLIPESALVAHNFPQGCSQHFIWRQEYCSLELVRAKRFLHGIRQQSIRIAQRRRPQPLATS